MTKIKTAIVGYGNIGRYALEAVLAAEDFVLVGVVRRNGQDIPAELVGHTVVDDIEKLGKVDVALLCSPTRVIGDLAEKILNLGINTVDSFDVHSEIVALKKRLDKAAKQRDSVAIVSAGWDPGSDSIMRALMLAMAPKGVTYTNFGPGMSMGHSVAAKAIDGVKDALSVTIPLGTGVHRRMVYVELAANANFDEVAKAI
ncbi:diaminopimelate dehydrogenase, partial [Escherichia coli]